MAWIISLPLYLTIRNILDLKDQVKGDQNGDLWKLMDYNTHQSLPLATLARADRSWAPEDS